MKNSKISVLLFLFTFLWVLSACDGSGNRNNTGGSDNPNTSDLPPVAGDGDQNNDNNRENGNNNGGSTLIPLSQRAPEINLEAGLRIPGIPTKSDIERTLRPPVSGGGTNPLDIPAQPGSDGTLTPRGPRVGQPGTPSLPGDISIGNPTNPTNSVPVSPATGVPDVDGIPNATFTRPGRINNFNAVAITPDSIRVSWTDIGTETQYRLFYRVQDTSVNTVGASTAGTTFNLAENTTTHMLTGLRPDTDYVVSIAAYNPAGQGPTQGRIVHTQPRPAAQVQVTPSGTPLPHLQPWGRVQVESEAPTELSGSLFQGSSYELGSNPSSSVLVAYYDANRNGILDEAMSAGYASGAYPYFYSNAQNDRMVSRGYRYEAGANLILEAQFFDQNVPMFVIAHLNYNPQAQTITAVRMFAGQNLLGSNITGENSIVAISSTDGVQNGTGEILLPTATQGGFLSLNGIRAYVIKPYSIDLGGLLTMYTVHNVINMDVSQVPLEAE